MRLRRFAAGCSLVAAAVVLSSCASPRRQADDCLADGGRLGLLSPREPDPGLYGLAGQIDHLEKHVEKYGSIVPQHASVWGQARLMMHRQEFEREMKADVGNFLETLQATASTSDQSFLASAFSLQAAVNGGKAPDMSAVAALVDKPSDMFGRTSLLPKALPFYAAGNGGLRLEPTTFEDQKKRFLDHLHELRRINEGDDNTDAPGYALNLVRLPVSVLPGDCTQTGYGAECTITATQHLPPDLLPTTFRNLVINDLIDLLAIPLTQVISATTEEELGALYQELKEQGPGSGQTVLNAVAQVTPSSKSPATARQAMAKKAAEHMNTFLANAGSLRQGKQRAMPPSQVIGACVPKFVVEVAIGLQRQLKDHLACNTRAYHLDVQAALRAELAAAYDLLATEQYRGVWDEFARPDLVEVIRNRDLVRAEDIARRFRERLDNGVPQRPTPAAVPPPTYTTTLALAWAVVLDSALLTDRFLQDMRRTHDDKGCACAPDHWLSLYHPCPPPEVCQQFNNYVACRWPLRIFALDPVTDDQNVADSYSMRRETQLALSLAFASGQISAGSFTRYTRRIERDIETIALNRTAVGFSHGDHTFGWRFYPRVQPPPVPGNIQAAFRDNLIGSYGPGYTLRRERLEPGIRECVALVIMPSFIPGIDLEVVGNWFRLAHPKCKALDLKDALKLSRSVRVLQDKAALACDHDRFRAGDGGTVLAKLDQVSQRLPLQHQQVEVPFENTHGGFELLSSGVTDLAPELVGWYGAPGIDPCADTALFLVGDNFSVHQTRVIVGGQMLDPACPAACTSSACIPGSGGCTACASAGAGGGAAAQTPAPAVVVPVLSTPAQMPPAMMIPSIPPAASSMSDGSPDKVPGVQPANFVHRKTGATTSPPVATANNTVTVSPTVTASPTASPTVSPTISPTMTVSTAGGGAATTVTATGTGAAAAKTSPCVYQVELLSRQVMRVVIPKGVQTKNGLVDVHIATPYGVSPALSIPVVCEGANCGGGDKKPAAPTVVVNPVVVAPPGPDAKPATPDYSIVAGDIQITYTITDPAKAPQLVKVSGKVHLTWNQASPSQPLTLTAIFPVKDGTAQISSGPLTFTNGSADLADDVASKRLTDFATALLAKLVPPNVDPGTKILTSPLRSVKVQIAPAAPKAGAQVKPADVDGAITVVLTPDCPPAMLDSPKPLPPKPLDPPAEKAKGSDTSTSGK